MKYLVVIAFITLFSFAAYHFSTSLENATGISKFFWIAAVIIPLIAGTLIANLITVPVDLGIFFLPLP